MACRFPGTDDAVGYGLREGEDKFAIKAWTDGTIAPSPRTHLAFAAASPAAVDAFHSAALAAGGRDNGPAGPRPHYGPGYYAAFVIDPDGHRIEAVHHGPG